MTPGTLARQFGDALLAAREADDEPRGSKARALGVTPATLREVEVGLGNPTLDRVERLADAYGLTVELVARREAHVDPSNPRPAPGSPIPAPTRKDPSR